MLARAAREASRRAAAPLRRYAAAPALVSDVTVPFTVVDYDGVRHKCVGRVGHNLVKSMQQQGLPMVLMGVQGYDAAVRVSREFQGKVPEMDLAHKSKMLELTYNVLPDATLASQLRLTRELANLEVALIKPMLEDNNPP
eukprot:PRCOL_00000937-RA